MFAASDSLFWLQVTLGAACSVIFNAKISIRSGKQTLLVSWMAQLTHMILVCPACPGDAHFYHKSGGQLVLCDLQGGILARKGAVLTGRMSFAAYFMAWESQWHVVRYC